MSFREGSTQEYLPLDFLKVLLYAEVILTLVKLR